MRSDGENRDRHGPEVKVDANGGAALLSSPDAIRAAVRQGIHDAMRDPALWAAVIAALQVHAQSQAGGWLFGGIRAVLSKLGWGVVIGLGVYLVGGWSALVALAKSIASGAH